MSYFGNQIDLILKNLNSQQSFFHKLASSGPPGSLNIRHYKGDNYFVHSVLDKNGKNIRRTVSNDSEILRRIALGKYGKIAQDILEKNISALEILKKDLIEPTPDNIIARMPARYQLIPRELYVEGLQSALPFLGSKQDPERPGGYFSNMNDLHFAEAWAKEAYPQLEYNSHEKNKETSRGLLVRSKSELAVCEKLYEYGIPFRYEQVINLGKQQLAPDFTFLNINRDEVYLEYCGMMDNPSYVNNFIWKRGIYERAGINEWENIIYIYEKGNSINVHKIEQTICNELIPMLQLRT